MSAQTPATKQQTNRNTFSNEALAHVMQRTTPPRGTAPRQARAQLQLQPALYPLHFVSHTIIHGFLSPAVNPPAEAVQTTSEATGMGISPTFLN